MIDYAEGLGYNVVGAINADFGYWETRIPCGMVVEDGVYKSSPEGNSCLLYTSLGGFAEALDVVCEVPYSDIPGFPVQIYCNRE